MYETEVAWAAGFFDGEGSSKKIAYHYKTKEGIKRPPTKNICLSVAQCDKRPLERFQHAVLNQGHINGPYQYKAQKRPYWVWSASCKSARVVFELLKPYLCEAKIKQYRTVTNDLVSVKSRKKGWYHAYK